MANKLWDKHPGVTSDHDLPIGDKAADIVRNGMGSWIFVFISLVFLSIWMLFNSKTKGFDPFPFILLNLLLSCVAAMQGAILLIAAKREDAVTAQLSVHHYEETASDREILKAVHELLEQNTKLTKELHDHIRST